MKTIESIEDIFEWTNAILPNSDEREDIRLANWIEENAPAFPCAWLDHPLSKLTSAEVSALVSENQ